MRFIVLSRERGALVDTEAMLLVGYDDSRCGELNSVGKKCRRAYHDVDALALIRRRECGLYLLFLRRRYLR